MKVRILQRPTGLINGQPWPEVGDVMDLNDATADGMAAAGWVEVVNKPVKKVEKRPASTKGVESRTSKE